MYPNAQNRTNVAANVQEYLNNYTVRLRIADVYSDLSIFDWWNENLSKSQLEQMAKFLKTAGELGFNGYVCFKVGAKYCSHGMWAHVNESTDGYSPKDGACLFHSFRSGNNYWDLRLPDGKWLHEMYPDKYEFTLKEIKAAMGL